MDASKKADKLPVLLHDMFMNIYICMYIYIYIERERERERDREIER